MKPPYKDALPNGWKAKDIGDAIEGGQRVLSANSFEVYGGGVDIWNERDDFRFVYKEVDGNFTLTTWVDEFDSIGDQWSKAGLMVRKNLNPDSPMFIINTLLSGELQAAVRKKKRTKSRERRSR